MLIRTSQSGDGMLLKQVRMRALADAPYAFGGPETLVREQSLPDSYWHELARELAGEVPEWRDRCVSYLILDGDAVCATASSVVCNRVPGRAFFNAAWVDPRYRRRGLGSWLVREASVWAAARGCDHMRLWVDDANPAAAEFYRALGFGFTGEIKPATPESALAEHSMEMRLVPGIKGTSR